MLDVLTPDETLELIKKEFAHIKPQHETVELCAAVGRVLYEDVAATEYVPGFDRSTVDGYAVKAADTFGCSDAIPAILQVAGKVLMGEEADMTLAEGQCCAVPTGGAVPQGADSVVMIEYTEDYGDGTVGIGKAAAPGQNMIFKGDDVFPGKTILKKGRRLSSQDIGALAAIGKAQVTVAKKPRIAVISTGDELVYPAETPTAGQVRDVNGALLSAMLTSFGAEPVEFGIIKDNEDELRNAVSAAVQSCDGVLLSGGSSVGEKDAAAKVIGSLGDMLLHGIAMKPGKPTILGCKGNKPILGVPGYPVSGIIVIEELLRPLVDICMGRGKAAYQTAEAVLTRPVVSGLKYQEFVRVRLGRVGDKLTASPLNRGSGVVSSFMKADGILEVPQGREGYEAGEKVSFFAAALPARCTAADTLLSRPAAL